MIGIYKILCTGNNQFYIGSSKNIKQRWYFHKKQLKEGAHHSSYLQRSYDKYGENSLEFSIILELKNYDEQELRDLEYYYIQKLNPKFNSAAPNICKCTKEWRNKISNSIKELFQNRENHPRFHKGNLYNVYDILGNILFENKSIKEIGELLNASYSTFNSMLRKYDGICCSTKHNYLIMEKSKTLEDLIYTYKNTLFNSKCSICDLHGNLFKRGDSYLIKSKPHKGRGITFKQVYKDIMNSENLYVSINNNIYTLPFLCHFVQQCTSNNS